MIFASMISDSFSANPFPVDPGFFEDHQGPMLQMLQRIVEMESPSDDKAAVDRLGQFLAGEFAAAGCKIRFHRTAEAGDHLQAEFPGRNSQKPVMLLGHFDTVWPLGTLEKMPFRIADGRAFGPGAFDMKAGIVMMLFALRALKDSGRQHRPVTILLDTDEEIGSTTSRPVVEATAKECEAVLVLEPAQGPRGLLKTSRKGVGDYTIRVFGQASHAGLDFEKGHSAILELSRQLLEVAKFVDPERGITVNPGVVHGGTRTNVVAAEALAEVDIRISWAADSRALEEKFTSLRPFDPHCRIEVSGGLNRPPMERTEGTVRLLHAAQAAARSLGMELGESAVGGGSDGNFTSALGIPTLDGMGAVGEGAHAIHESIVLAELPRRAALLTSLLATI
jgi:glutamate carboxypeptidase